MNDRLQEIREAHFKQAKLLNRDPSTVYANLRETHNRCNSLLFMVDELSLNTTDDGGTMERIQARRIEKLEAQLERKTLALKTCQGNCTTHELNEAKALEQLAAEENATLQLALDGGRMYTRIEELEAQLAIGGSCNLHDKRIEKLEAQLEAANGDQREWGRLWSDVIKLEARLAELYRRDENHIKIIEGHEAQLDAEKAGGKMVFIRYESIVQKLEARLEATQLRLKTCSTNCTTHELNEAKALAQLAAVRNCKYVIVNGMEFCLRDDIKAAIGEGET